MRPRPVLHETETETKKWSRDHAGLEKIAVSSLYSSQLCRVTLCDSPLKEESIKGQEGRSIYVTYDTVFTGV